MDKRKLQALSSRWLIFVSALLLVFFTASSSAAKKPPEWLLNPIQDTPSHMYGVGEGASLSNATQAALETIAGRLLTHIESDLEVSMRSVNETVSSSVESNVRSQIGDTKISGYAVDATAKSGRTYYVRVKVDKAKLLSSNTTALDNALDRLNEYLGAASQTSSLRVYKYRRKLQRTLNDARQKLFVVQALSDAPQVQTQQQQISVYEQTLNARLSGLIVYVTASDELKEFSQKIVQQLSQEGIKATTHKPAQSAPEVRLQGSFKRDVRFDQKYVIANTSIDVYDEFLKPLSSKQLIIDGQAFLSHESAITSAINRTIDELSQEGIARALGLI